MPVPPLRRYIEESLSRHLQWAVFEPNGEALWDRIRREADGFMLELFRQGKLAGSKPDQAYWVKCGRDTMTQADIDRGNVIVLIGFAQLKPAEFVVIEIQQWTGETKSS